MAPSLPHIPRTGPLLAVTDLGRRHPEGSDWLFRHIEFEIHTGDRLALVGATGSGKSLILRALALLDPVDQGEVSWCGRPIADSEVPDYRGRVMYLQQQSPILEGSVEDNLNLPFQLQLRHGGSLPKEQVDRLLESLGRDSSFLTNRTANLSGGERQLVAVMRALLAAPSLLLLDEPSAALDPQATLMLEALIDSWHAEAPTERAYVWVSHDAAQAQRVGQRFIHLANGMMEADT
jgi:putative ABC transport system ATP-binding protein